jgi:hypothetical protein
MRTLLGRRGTPATFQAENCRKEISWDNIKVGLETIVMMVGMRFK